MGPEQEEAEPPVALRAVRSQAVFEEVEEIEGESVAAAAGLRVAAWAQAVQRGLVARVAGETEGAELVGVQAAAV